MEIYNDISQTVKDTAEAAWRAALAQKNPVEASNFLNLITNYYKHIFTEEEIDFLRFYFNMKMEMMKSE